MKTTVSDSLNLLPKEMKHFHSSFFLQFSACSVDPIKAILIAFACFLAEPIFGRQIASPCTEQSFRTSESEEANQMKPIKMFADHQRAVSVICFVSSDPEPFLESDERVTKL